MVNLKKEKDTKLNSREMFETFRYLLIMEQ